MIDLGLSWQFAKSYLQCFDHIPVIFFFLGKTVPDHQKDYQSVVEMFQTRLCKLQGVAVSLQHYLKYIYKSQCLTVRLWLCNMTHPFF